MVELDRNEKIVLKEYKHLLEKNDVSQFFNQVYIELHDRLGVSEVNGYGSVAKIRRWLEEHNIDLLPMCEQFIPEAMFNCSQMTDASIPEGVIFTDTGSFLGCHNLRTVEIPSTLEILGDKTFLGCDSLRKIDIPVGVKYIGYQCFEYCHNLKEIYLPSTMNIIKENAFYSCNPHIEIYCKFDPDKIHWGDWTAYKDFIIQV